MARGATVSGPILVACDWCGDTRPWGGRIFRSFKVTLFYCRTSSCTRAARAYGEHTSVPEAEQARLAYRLAANLRRRLVVMIRENMDTSEAR